MLDDSGTMFAYNLPWLQCLRTISHGYNVCVQSPMVTMFVYNLPWLQCLRTISHG